jgi:adenylyltransferase/sulfurtransferase
MKISISDLKNWRDQSKPHFLIDIREQYEVDHCSIGGHVFPMETVMSSSDQFPKDIPLIIHCNSGKRSDATCYALQKKLHRFDIYSLEGGIQAYSQAFEPENNCAQS